MTRLRREDISNIAATLVAYNKNLVTGTGHTLAQIAACAAGTEVSKVSLQGEKVAVIPFTCGQGVIEGFAQAVASIASFLGCDGFVTERPDACGIAEAVEKGARVLMMADDERFVAVNLTSGKFVDNAEATGKGYAAALDLMVKGLKNKKVLLVGAGPVGISAALAMARLGAIISVYDIVPASATWLTGELNVKYGYPAKVETDLDSALRWHRIIFDACPAPAFIEEEHITGETFVAAPGIPLGLKPEALVKVSGRLLHDPLQIGVATMIYEVFKGAVKT